MRLTTTALIGTQVLRIWRDKKMIKVTTADVIKQLVSRGVFEFKKDAEYQIDIKDEQIVVNRYGSPVAYLGNTLESVIQLAEMFKKIGTKEQQKQINAALADLVTIGDYWNEA